MSVLSLPSMDENDQNLHPVKSSSPVAPNKAPSPVAAVHSETSSTDGYGIEIVSTDHTRIGLPKRAEEKKTQHFQGTHVKSKTKIKIKIPLPWKWFRMSTRTLCTLTVAAGLFIVVSACAGVGVYFLTSEKKESSKSQLWIQDRRTWTRENKQEIHQIEIPNMKEHCNALVNVSSDCVFTTNHYHKDCLPVKCYRITYVFLGTKHGDDNVATIEIDEKNIALLQPSAHTYCGPGKWCTSPDSLTETFECREHNHEEPTRFKELSSPTWVDNCEKQYSCMSVAKDSLTRSVFQTIQSYFTCPDKRTPDCEQGLVEAVPQIHFVTCDNHQTGGACEGWPMQVRKCFTCPKYKDMFRNITSKKYLTDDNMMLHFTTNECTWSVWKNNVTVALGLKPDGSGCLSRFTKEVGLCVLGSCFVLGANTSVINCS